MAKTSQPIVWDFYRHAGHGTELGAVEHYHSEESQSLFVDQNFYTEVFDVAQGAWENAPTTGTYTINPSKYSALSFDHPYVGTLFGAAVLDGQLTYLRYVYAIDCSNLVITGTMDSTNDNPVVQLKVNIINIGEEIFTSEVSLFQPGAKIVLRFLVGGERVQMCVAYMDSIDFNPASSSVSFSGRNSIGYRLVSQVFEDFEQFQGDLNALTNAVFSYAGLQKYIVGPDSLVIPLNRSFSPDQTLLDGLQSEYNFLQRTDWRIYEREDGTVLAGDQNFLANYVANSYYIFDTKAEVFSRKTKQALDAAYSRFCLTGKMTVIVNPPPEYNVETGEWTIPEPEPQEVELRAYSNIKNYEYWNIPPHKTYFMSMDSNSYVADLTTLQNLADQYAQTLQYVGIGEEFTGPLRPQIIVGDIAAENNGDGTMTTLGIVTRVTHKFGRAGFSTSFSTDSGGTVTDLNGNVIPITRSLNGYTRKQSLKDLIKFITK